MANMRAVYHDPAGCASASGMKLISTDIPQPAAGHALVKVAASAINRADILQRKNLYPPPKGASDFLGLEMAGEIAGLPENTSGKWKVGDRVMGLLNGGGYAEYATINEDHLMHVPTSVDLNDAAGIPEAWLTAFQILTFVANIKQGDWVLVHAGASGVGTAAIQLITKVFGAKAIATVGSKAKADFVASLGAAPINYKEEGFADRVEQITDGHGADIIMDCIGASYVADNVRAIAMDGSWVVYGLMGGAKTDEPLLSGLMRKRISISGTTLRSRSDEYKKRLTEKFSEVVLPHFVSGSVRPIVDTMFSLGRVAEAHEHMEANKNIGKVILVVQNLAVKDMEDHSEL